jgi:hypothetical protein
LKSPVIDDRLLILAIETIAITPGVSSADGSRCAESA